MIIKRIVPTEFPCSLEDCPPGPFIPLNRPDSLCMKSEYGGKAYNEAGEFYRSESFVYPVQMEDFEI